VARFLNHMVGAGRIASATTAVGIPVPVADPYGTIAIIDVGPSDRGAGARLRFLVWEGRGDDGEGDWHDHRRADAAAEPSCSPPGSCAPKGHLGAATVARQRARRAGSPWAGTGRVHHREHWGVTPLPTAGCVQVRRSPPCVGVEVGTFMVPGQADQQHQTRRAVINGCWFRVARSASFARFGQLPRLPPRLEVHQPRRPRTETLRQPGQLAFRPRASLTDTGHSKFPPRP
jgi:hypothetical protein